jgi:hypothetical protein
MGACYGGTDVMERSCAVARGIDINNRHLHSGQCTVQYNAGQKAPVLALQVP